MRYTPIIYVIQNLEKFSMTKKPLTIDIAIITALKIECAPVLALLDKYEQIQEDEHTYYRGQLAIDDNICYEIVVALMLEIGNLDAGIITTTLIKRWHPKNIIMMGIAAAARKDKVNFGDVVVAEFCHFYEFVKKTDKGEQRRPHQLPSSPVLLERAKNFQASGWHESIKVALPNSVQGVSYVPQVHFGAIGSSEPVIADDNTLALLIKECPELIAVAREGAGVARAAHHAGLNFIEVRGLCEFAPSNQNDEWQLSAASVAAVFLIAWLRSGTVPYTPQAEKTDNRPPECPYPGMRPFREADSHYFFGRNQEIQQFLEGPHLRLHRVVALIGPSGSGKSSLVFAGLLPALKQSGLFGAGEWQVHSMRPGETPLTTLKQVLGCEPTQLQIAPPQRLLLIIDQFEALFTIAKQEALPFQQALQTLLYVPHCYLVLTVRADFYPELMSSLLWKTIQKHRQEVLPLEDAGLREAIVKPAESVAVSVETALVERLVAEAAGEPGRLPFVQETLVLLWERLEKRFLPLAAYEALVLPQKANNGRGERPLTALQVAMANHADATLADLEDNQQVIARRLFLRLIPFGEGRPDTRLQQSVAALRRADDDVQLFDATLEHLVAHRLLTRSATETDGQVDIAHDALINGWPQLQQWLTERRQAELTRRQLETKVAHWESLNRAGGLLEALELSAAENWLNSPDAKELGYSEALLTLVQKSRAAIEAAETGAVLQRDLKQAQALLAEEQRKRAEEQELATKKLRQAVNIATQQKNQALRIQSLFLADLARQEIEKGNVTEGILLSLEALPKDIATPNRPYLNEAQIQLNSAVFKLQERLVMPGHTATFSPDGTKIVTTSGVEIYLLDTQSGQLLNVLEGHTSEVTNAAFSFDGQCIVTASWDKTARLWEAGSGQLLNVLEGHTKGINNAVFSPDGQRIVTASEDKTARLWEARSGQLLNVLEGHTGSVINAAFSFNGQRIVTASWDKTARLWDASNSQLLNVLEGHTDKINNAAFSPDGQCIVTASWDKTARLWDASNGQQFNVFEGHTDQVTNAAFSPYGLRIVTSSYDKTARLWDANSGQLLNVLEGHTDQVTNAAFSPNGQRIVTASYDKTARLWDASSGQRLNALEGHTGSVINAAFSPDGQHIVTASYDNSARLWNASNSQLLNVLEGHTNIVNNTAFSPDGQRIVTDSGDHTTRLWDVGSGRLLNLLDGYILNAAFSPDGQCIVTASRDNSARLWDASSGQLLNVLEGHTDLIWNAAFCPDGQRIVTGSDDETARLWDVSTGQLLNVNVLEGYSSGLLGLLAFSPDGQRIVTGSDDETARLWDASSGQLLNVLEGHKSEVFNAVFSPDSQRFVTTGGLWDETARLWDASSGQLVNVLKGHEWWVNNAAFSFDGQRLVTVGDKTARLWDAQSGQLLNVLEGHTDGVTNAAFSPDGQRIVTASSDQTARLWDASSGQLLNVLKGHTDTVNNAAFSPDGQRIVTTSEDNTARLWYASNGQLVNVLEEANNAAFSPDGLRIVTASDDNTALLWYVFQTTQELIDYANQNVPRCLSPQQREQFFLEPDPSYALIEAGEQLAQTGDIEGAVAKFKQAQTLAPCQKLDPKYKVAKTLIEKGRALAKEGQIEAAVEQFKQAQKVDERFKFGDGIEEYARWLSTD
jgi:WD40 repeat protein/nucleoside phosphorylase/energy-coupling factor transporter ATP-binding protein EcfA2